jgi:hypothetical protein
VAKVKKTGVRAARGINSLRENFVRWEGLATNARPHLADIASLESYLTAFDEVLGRIRVSLFEQDVQTAKVSALVRARKDDVAKARDLRKRVTGLIRVHFGSDSEKLREFGLKPESRSRRKPAGEEPPPETEPGPKPEPGPEGGA